MIRRRRAELMNRKVAHSQVPLAEQIKLSLPPDCRIPVSTVGLITQAHQAEEILQDGKADVARLRFSFLYSRFSLT